MHSIDEDTCMQLGTIARVSKLIFLFQRILCIDWAQETNLTVSSTINIRQAWLSSYQVF